MDNAVNGYNKLSVFQESC